MHTTEGYYETLNRGTHRCTECEIRFRTARQLIHHFARKHKE